MNKNIFLIRLLAVVCFGFLASINAYSQSMPRQFVTKLLILEVEKNDSIKGFDVSPVTLEKLSALGTGKVKKIGDSVLMGDEGKMSQTSSGTQIPITGTDTDGKPIIAAMVNAGSRFQVVPESVLDKNGALSEIKLTYEIDDNEVDKTVTLNGVPSVKKRAFKARVAIKPNEVVVIGSMPVGERHQRYYFLTSYAVQN